MRHADRTSEHRVGTYNALRQSVKIMAERILIMYSPVGRLLEEEDNNLVLVYRHLEDASMRLGKAIQAVDGGVSVYDRETTVGA